VSNKPHNPEPLFAVDVEPIGAELSRNLAAYRRLTDNQKAAVAAELKKKVEIEIAASRGTRRVFVERAKLLHPFRLLSLSSRSILSIMRRRPPKRTWSTPAIVTSFWAR
jgi:hypothetical protein